MPYLGYQAVGLQGTAYDLVSNYNSLQVTARKQFSHGFTVQAAYTLASPSPTRTVWLQTATILSIQRSSMGRLISTGPAGSS